MSKAGESLLLDSSVIVFGFKSHPAVLDVLDQSVHIHVPVIAYGELYNGALKSQAPEKKLKQLGEFIKATTLLDVDWHTAQCYGKVRRRLEEKGRPIPENDIWIAALALQHSLRLFARDQHFNEIKGLDVLQLND